MPASSLYGELLHPTLTAKWRLYVKKLIGTLILPAVLVVCIAQLSWATAEPTGGSMSGTIAEYNAAQVLESQGHLTVPSGMVAYTARYTAIPTGTTFIVSLPAGFEFTTLPTLTNSAATFTLLNMSGGTARFRVVGAPVAVGGTIVLGGYRVKGATVLEQISPPGAALPLTMQAIGIDPQPLPFSEFASDSGIVATVTGNSLTVDLAPPSYGRQFYAPPGPPTAGFFYATQDTITVQLGSVTITPEATDASGIPVMAPDGTPNALAPYDIATLELPGYSFAGVSVYGSLYSNCLAPAWPGQVTATALIFPDLPINQQVFLCAKASGGQMVKLFGFPNTETTFGFETGFLLNPRPYTDFLSSGNVGFSSFGQVCYAVAPPFNNTCAPEFYSFFSPGSPE